MFIPGGSLWFLHMGREEGIDKVCPIEVNGKKHIITRILLNTKKYSIHWKIPLPLPTYILENG
jgi:hypothetical protein